MFPGGLCSNPKFKPDHASIQDIHSGVNVHFFRVIIIFFHRNTSGFHHQLDLQLLLILNVMSERKIVDGLERNEDVLHVILLLIPIVSLFWPN